MARKPRGKPSKLTKAELLKQTTITPEDVAAARKAWRDDVPARFRGLMDAKPSKVRDDK